jgi:hypothetical protein
MNPPEQAPSSATLTTQIQSKVVSFPFDRIWRIQYDDAGEGLKADLAWFR